jgi:hypothetical protein
MPKSSNIISIQETSKLCNIMRDVDRFYQHLTDQAIQTSGLIYRQQSFSGYFIVPLVHELLSMQAPVVIDDSGLAILQACRLAILLSLAEVRRLFGIYPVSSTVQVRKLYALLSPHPDWKGLEDLEIWVLSMGIIEAEAETERKWLLDEWTRVTQRLGYRIYEAVESLLQSLPWMVEIHGTKLRKRILNGLFEMKTQN